MPVIEKRKPIRNRKLLDLALGGMHDDSNFQLLCPFCNKSKGAKDPVEFMQSKGFLL